MTVRRKPRLLQFLLVVAVAGAVVLAYELGRLNGGFSSLDQRRERESLMATIAERDRAIENLQRTIAILETSQDIDRETYAQVEVNLDELQARIQAQEEELAFYRGIISPEDGLAGLRVQTLELRPIETGSGYVLHLVLVQAITHDRRVSGTVSFDIAGTLDGNEVRYSLEDLVADDSPEALAYSFRYFQDLQRELVLPEGFRPSELLMVIRPREPSGDVLEQVFDWASVAG
jgi:hypothetical protein